MKIKKHLAFYIPLLALVALLCGWLLALPPEPRGISDCKRDASCMAIIHSFAGWPNWH